MQDEKMLENGLTDQSKLFVTVIEAKDLLNDSLISDCSPSVTLSFQNDVQETKVKKKYD